mgnify:CR=1 FL=1
MSLILLLRPIGAHPRLRGEHSVLNAHPLTDCGSSPLTRGARVVLGVRARVRGLIPAYAGSTRKPLCLWGAFPAHPRLRGEHSAATLVSMQFMGSSPLTRGALMRCLTVPHAPGSSPLTRGALFREFWRVGCEGLIPAYAGSTACGDDTAFKGEAHPRLRGEHVKWFQSPGGAKGSSPLTRGALKYVSKKEKLQRLIPAYAGSTPNQKWALARRKAHPRLRGEHIADLVEESGTNGSSPLTRGAQVGRVHHGFRPGLIPAYAGSTLAEQE